jgi:hypothetical protein
MLAPMGDHIQLDFLPAALDHLFARHGVKLQADWDGGTDRVGFILSIEDDADRAHVGFWTRTEAAKELRGRADGGDPQSEALRAIAVAVTDGPRPRGVQCVILGGGLYALVEIEIEDMRSPLTSAWTVTNEDVANMLLQCMAQEGALRAVGEVRILFRAELEGEIPELEGLEKIIELRWEDVSAVAAATERARAATERYVPTSAGQRCRFVLNMLGTATGKRRPDRPNAPGGSA